MRVTILSSDLSENCLGRALVLRDVLARDHDVRILGTRFGSRIWPPAADRVDALSGVSGGRWPGYRRNVAELIDRLEGDVIVAVKPLLPSYGVALLARRRTGTPIVLDIDDDEVALSPLPVPWRLPSSVRDPDGPLTRRFMQRLVPRADARVVASRGLQDRFGGHLVWHAKDTGVLRPGGDEAAARWRAELGLSTTPLVLFLGTPRPWKGVLDAAEAVARVPGARLLVVGLDESPYSRRVARHPAVTTVGMVPQSMVPTVVAAADVVVVPQRAHPVTATQVPSKLFDGMAMARPIVATAVSDIPHILAGGRGRVVAPGDVEGMGVAIGEILDDPPSAAAMGRAARAWCVAHASLEASREPLNRALAEARANRRMPRVGRGAPMTGDSDRGGG